MTTTYDTVLQREEYLSPEEYLRRRAKGEIDPAKSAMRRMTRRQAKAAVLG